MTFYLILCPPRGDRRGLISRGGGQSDTGTSVIDPFGLVG